MNDADLIFGDIEISGFMSFPPRVKQKLHLDTNQLTAIIGENLDGGPGERNGAGKTSIIDALQYLYFGRTSRVSNQGFLNYIEPGPLLVSGWAQRAGIIFQVQRGENPAVLRLWEKPTTDHRDLFDTDGNRYVFETTKSTKPETTKRIVELLGFDFKLFDVLLVNNPADRSCYFLKSQEEQRDIQERIFGFTVFTEKADRLRDLRRDETKNLATKESAFIATRQANDRVLAEITQLEDKAKTWTVNRDRMVQFLTQQINSYKGVDFAAERIVLETRAQMETALSQIERDAKMAEQSTGQTEMRHRQWLHKHQEDMANLEQTLTILSQTDVNTDIDTLRKRDLLNQTLAVTEDHITTLTNNLTPLRLMLRQEQANHQTAQNNITLLEAKIIKLDESKCPTCGQDWADTQNHLAHCIEELENTTAELNTATTNLANLNEQITEIEATLKVHDLERLQINANIDDLPKTHFRTIEEAATAFGRTAEITKKLTETKNLTCPFDETLAEEKITLAEMRVKLKKQHTTLDKQKLIKTTFTTLGDLDHNYRNFETVQNQFAEYQQSENPYRETIDNLRNNALKVVDETEIRDLKKQIEHMSLLITLLADKDSPIRKAVLNEWLPELNLRVNRHIDFLELPHRVNFDADMTAEFTLNNHQLSFGNLSTGQRLRVWLATNLAFTEIFELINYKINLLFVDEVLDKGMSTRGAEVSYKLLNQIVQQDKSVFLISHRTELCDLADNVLNIKFENGLTRIAA
jgi:DNA repair exonuclease SbcCD ATPase subunit